MQTYNDGQILAYVGNKYLVFRIVGSNVKYVVSFTDENGVTDVYHISRSDPFAVMYTNAQVSDYSFRRLTGNCSRRLLYRQTDNGIEVATNYRFTYNIKVEEIGTFGKTIDTLCVKNIDDAGEWTEFENAYVHPNYNSNDLEVNVLTENNRNLLGVRTNSYVSLGQLSKNQVKDIKLLLSVNFITGLFELDINLRTDANGNPLIHALCKNRIQRSNYFKLYYKVESSICYLYLKVLSDYTAISVLCDTMKNMKLEVVPEPSNVIEQEIFYYIDTPSANFPNNIMDTMIDYTDTSMLIFRGGKKFNVFGQQYGKIQGIFANRPTFENGNSNYGYSYFCTDLKTPEEPHTGVVIFHKGSNVWIDALGRVVESDYPAKYRGAFADRPTLTNNDAGRQYLDTTNWRIITWTGSVWVDATGSPV